MPDVPGGTSLPAPVPTRAQYTERLAIGPFGWVLLAVFALMIGIAFYPVDVRLAAAVALGVLALGVYAMVATAPVVRVDPTTFRAGEAQIPRTLVGTVVALDATETRAELGTRLDARAFLCQRGWIHTAVRVDLVDPLDPTPYWIVSTRHPDDLVAALARP